MVMVVEIFVAEPAASENRVARTARKECAASTNTSRNVSFIYTQRLPVIVHGPDEVCRDVTLPCTIR